MLMHDKVVVGEIALTAEGYMRAPAKIARTGVQQYYGFELGLREDGEADKLFSIWRPADEVFDRAALDSFAMKPVTDGHPFENVTATSWKAHAVGMTGETVARDGDHVRAWLLITDSEAINVVQRGSGELSCGYDCTVEMTPGVTDDGEPYDGVQRQIRGNHVAIVPKGRCGPTCRVGDQAMQIKDCAGNPRCRCSASQPQQKEDDKPMTKPVTVDGRTFEVADDVAAVIEALQGKIADSATSYQKLKDATAELAGIVEKYKGAKDEAIAAKDAEIEALKKAVPTAQQLDALATERASLIAKAKEIAPAVEIGDKSAAEIRRAVVAAKMGDEAVKDRSDDYIAAAFDTLAVVKPGAADPARAALAGGQGAQLSPRDAYLKRISEAHLAR